MTRRIRQPQALQTCHSTGFSSSTAHLGWCTSMSWQCMLCFLFCKSWQLGWVGCVTLTFNVRRCMGGSTPSSRVGVWLHFHSVMGAPGRLDLSNLAGSREWLFCMYTQFLYSNLACVAPCELQRVCSIPEQWISNCQCMSQPCLWQQTCPECRHECWSFAFNFHCVSCQGCYPDIVRSSNNHVSSWDNVCSCTLSIDVHL